MKNTKTLFSTVLCGLVFAITVAASAQNINQGVATVVRVQGRASYTLESGPNARWFPLVAGKFLMSGSSVRTDSNGTVDMVLGKKIEMPQASSAPSGVGPSWDAPIRGLVAHTPSVEQNTVRLTSGTTLKIDKLTVSDTGVDTVSDTELDLQKGRIFANVKKLSAASQYLIKIPSGIAGVRGTYFGIDASGWCAVLSHMVDLALVSPDGKVVSYSIAEGTVFDPATGQSTALPQALRKLLEQVGAVLKTTYLQITSFAGPRTECYVSPTAGHHGGNGGGGNGGGGNGGGGNGGGGN